MYKRRKNLSDFRAGFLDLNWWLGGEAVVYDAEANEVTNWSWR